MIPAFDCASTLVETLRSVLEQAPGPQDMQIEVVDDASPRDDVAEVVRAIGAGRVDYWRQPANQGVARNLNSCIQRARGHIVHLLHGDDAVSAGFYAALGDAFAQRPDLGAAFCRARYVDATGREIGLSPEAGAGRGPIPRAPAHLAREQRIMTPSIAVARRAFEALGGFDTRLEASEDWEMWVRIAAHFPIWYEPDALASYRVHDVSNTGRHARTGRDAHFNAVAIDMMAAYLPPDEADEVRRSARTTYARTAIAAAVDAFARGDIALCVAQLRGALHLSRSPAVLLGAAALPLRSTSRRILAAFRSGPAKPQH